MREYTEDLHYLHSSADGEPSPAFKTIAVPAADEIGTLMRAANRVLDGMSKPLPHIFPGDELRFNEPPARPQAPGRDLEDDGA